GTDFRYATEIGIGKAGGQTHIYIKGSGDPTLGSWRWKNHSESEVMSRITQSIRRSGVSSVGQIFMDDKKWQAELVPDGWIWQDVGNYYGAGPEVLNWRENQYDLVLRSGSNLGDPVSVVSTKPFLYHYSFQSYVTSAAKGSGDQSYIYLPLGGLEGTVRGTIPINENGFVISGAMPSPRKQFIATLSDSLSAYSIAVTNNKTTSSSDSVRIIHRENSPSLDSIIYWFLRKSINLYGEALAKSFAFQANDYASITNGVKRLKDFWVQQGIAKTELNMYDGSGLSPLNRVTTNAQVKVLQYARSRPWYKGFYDGFPEFNGMKMKSGTISGAKGFCGYHRSNSGQEYIFSFIVNNYNGGASALVQKMYKVLDELK
ncbi:MAG: D-alanyl-D-alanine carboxypeptidase/D-alanyl-D-alanine-endopeptidase, partial [Flavisolibacter sp.]|nr:D-alanyl-D-alanine carboxypeptidase/D-alanyl-D-alanine-endopeptidase [Flavisolibacter sp.]